MPFAALNPSNTTAIEPLKDFPLALAGICHVHTAWLPTKWCDLARSETPPTFATQTIWPPFNAAPVSERMTVSFALNALPALGVAGDVTSFFTASRGGAVFTSNE